MRATHKHWYNTSHGLSFLLQQAFYRRKTKHQFMHTDSPQALQIDTIKFVECLMHSMHSCGKSIFSILDRTGRKFTHFSFVDRFNILPSVSPLSIGVASSMSPSWRVTNFIMLPWQQHWRNHRRKTRLNGARDHTKQKCVCARAPRQLLLFFAFLVRLLLLSLWFRSCCCRRRRLQILRLLFFCSFGNKVPTTYH